MQGAATKIGLPAGRHHVQPRCPTRAICSSSSKPSKPNPRRCAPRLASELCRASRPAPLACCPEGGDAPVATDDRAADGAAVCPHSGQPLSAGASAAATRTPFQIEPLEPKEQLKSVSNLAVYGLEEATLRWAQTYGPVFRLDNSKVPGQKSLVFLTDPELVEHVCRTNAQNYSERFLPDVYPYAMQDKGFVSSQGDYNRKHRAMASPTFTLSGFQRGFMEQTAAKTRELLAVWRAARPGGTVEVDMANQMQRLTLDIIGDVAFTYDFGGIDAIKAELAGGRAEGNDKLLNLINVSMEEIGKMAVPFITRDMLEKASKWGVPPVRRMEEAMEGMRTLCEPMIQERRRAMKAGEDTPEDLLGSLVRIQLEGDEEISDFELWEDVHDVMGAGHETSANVLTCALWEVAMHPEVGARCRAELDEVLAGGRPCTYNDFAEGRLPYTAAVVKEALRLYPPLPIFPRLASEDDALPTGHIVPGGDVVFMSAYAMGRLESLWPRAYAFRPERFLGDEAAGRHPYAWVPFGAGPRMCLGSNFALASTTVVLATCLQEYEFEALSPTERPESQSDLLLPDGSGRWRGGMPFSYDMTSCFPGGVEMRVSPRRDEV